MEKQTDRQQRSERRGRDFARSGIWSEMSLSRELCVIADAGDQRLCNPVNKDSADSLLLAALSKLFSVVGSDPISIVAKIHSETAIDTSCPR